MLKIKKRFPYGKLVLFCLPLLVIGGITTATVMRPSSHNGDTGTTTPTPAHGYARQSPELPLTDVKPNDQVENKKTEPSSSKSAPTSANNPENNQAYPTETSTSTAQKVTSTIAPTVASTASKVVATPVATKTPTITPKEATPQSTPTSNPKPQENSKPTATPTPSKEPARTEPTIVPCSGLSLLGLCLPVRLL